MNWWSSTRQNWSRRTQRRFVIRMTVATFACLLAVSSPAWVEALTGLNPDGGDGSLEWLIAIAAAAVALLVLTGSSSLRRRRRSRHLAVQAAVAAARGDLG